MLSIEFNEELHQYTVTPDGGQPRVWPGVSQVMAPLQNFAGIPADVLERAKNFGKAVHKMVELYNNNDLDESQLDPALAPFLTQYKAALGLTGWRVIASEYVVAHPLLAYCGTLDLHVENKKGDQGIVDVKSGSTSKTVGPQTIAYVDAHCAMTGDKRKFFRACLYLKNDRFQVVPLKDDAGDRSIFVSCNNILKWKEAHP